MSTTSFLSFGPTVMVVLKSHTHSFQIRLGTGRETAYGGPLLVILYRLDLERHRSLLLNIPLERMVLFPETARKPGMCIVGEENLLVVS